MLDKYRQLPEELQDDLNEVFLLTKEIAERYGYKITGDDNWAKVDEAIACNMLNATEKNNLRVTE